MLYALIGEQEQKDPTMRWGLAKHGWPWSPISSGFNQPDRITDIRVAGAAPRAVFNGWRSDMASMHLNGDLRIPAESAMNVPNCSKKFEPILS